MQHVSMGSNGRLVIPSGVRSEIGMPEGGAMVVSVQDGKVVLEPYRDVLARVQAQVRAYVPEGISLVDEVIQDRRDEAERE